ncbi:MAG: hypothetical protein IJ506_02735 [Clostridia bacterium]|nr:hypothetical protein [Clostridia bacterium]
MKLFKKTAALLLSLAMGLSFVGCNTGDDSADKDNDKTPTPPPASGGNGLTDEELQDAIGDLIGGFLGDKDSSSESTGKQYVDGAIQAIENANTVELSFDADIAYSFTDKQYGNKYEDDLLIRYGDNETQTLDLTASGTLKAVKTEDSYDLALEITLDYEETWLENEETVTDKIDNETGKIYIVDGYAYLNKPNQDEWVKTLMPVEYASIYNELVGILDQCVGENGAVSEDDLTYLKTLAGKIFDGVAKIENNALKFELDLATPANEILDHYKNLDLTMTVEEYLDDVLAEFAGETVTVDALLATLATMGDYTVGEAYGEIDSWLETATGMGVEELKDAILEQEDVAYLLGKLEALGYIQVNEEFDIDEHVKNFKDITMDELFAEMTGFGEEEGSVPNIPSVPQTALAYFAYSLDQSFQCTFEEAGLDVYVNELKGITVNEAKEAVKIGFEGFNLQSLDFDASADFVADLSIGKIVLDATVAIDLRLSDAKSAITLPASATTIYYGKTNLCFPNDYYIDFSLAEKEIEDRFVYDFTKPGDGSLAVQVGQYVVSYDFEYTVPKAVAGESIASIEVKITDGNIGKGEIEEGRWHMATTNTDYSALFADCIGKTYTLTLDAAKGEIGFATVPVPTTEQIEAAASVSFAGEYVFQSYTTTDGTTQTTYTVGDTLNGIVLTEDYQVLSVYSDGTAKLTAQVGDGSTQPFQMTWVKSGTQEITFILSEGTTVCYCDGNTIRISDGSSTTTLVKPWTSEF